MNDPAVYVAAVLETNHFVDSEHVGHVCVAYIGNTLHRLAVQVCLQRSTFNGMKFQK